MSDRICCLYQCGIQIAPSLDPPIELTCNYPSYPLQPAKPASYPTSRQPLYCQLDIFAMQTWQPSLLRRRSQSTKTPVLCLKASAIHPLVYGHSPSYQCQQHQLTVCTIYPALGTRSCSCTSVLSPPCQLLGLMPSARMFLNFGQDSLQNVSVSTYPSPGPPPRVIFARNFRIRDSPNH